MTPSTSRVIIFVTAILAVAAIVVYAIVNRDSAFEASVDSKGRIVLKFDNNEVSFAQVLDDIFNAEDASKKNAAEDALAGRGYYHYTDVALVNALRDLQRGEETEEFAVALRGLLYDLHGPFARPDTLSGARDDRLLAAFEDLDPKLSEVDPEAVNPLLSALWRMSLNIEGIFRPRAIRAELRSADNVPPRQAAACINSFLDRKEVFGSIGGELWGVMVEGGRLCSQAPPSVRALLAGWPEELHVAPSDFRRLASAAGVDGDAATVTIELVISPKYYKSFGSMVSLPSEAPIVDSTVMPNSGPENGVPQ